MYIRVAASLRPSPHVYSRSCWRVPLAGRIFTKLIVFSPSRVSFRVAAGVSTQTLVRTPSRLSFRLAFRVYL